MNTEIIGWVICFENEPKSAKFVPRAMSVTDILLAMQWEKPESVVYITPVKTTPEWAVPRRC